MNELRQQLGQMHQAGVVQLNYAKTLLLLRALKAGTVKLENVFLDGDNWSLVEVKEPEPQEAPAG